MGEQQGRKGCQISGQGGYATYNIKLNQQQHFMCSIIFSNSVLDRVPILNSIYLIIKQMEKTTEPRQQSTARLPKRKYQFRNKTDKREGTSNNFQGPWSSQENLAFAAFMTLHFHTFSSKKHRKSTKAFTFLSQYLKTRTAQQCRSHFQKVIAKYDSINKFKAYCKRISGNQAFHEKLLGCPNFQNVFSEKIQKQEKKNSQRLGIMQGPEQEHGEEGNMKQEEEEEEEKREERNAGNNDQQKEMAGGLWYFWITPNYFFAPY